MTKKTTLPARDSSVLQPVLRQRPLIMQLGLASASLAQPRLVSGQSFGNDFWVEGGGKAAKASMQKVIEGLRRYQMHDYQRPLQHHSVIWSDGEARLLWYAAKTTKKNPLARAQILMVPSLINGSEILDILPKKKSLVHWLTQQGYDVFLMQWGHLRDDPELYDLEGVIAVKMKKMTDWLVREKSGAPLIGLGYCMGGLLLAASEMLSPDFFDALVFIATPWDFSKGGKRDFPAAIRCWAAEGGLVRTGHLDYMPNEWLQLIFSGVDPELVVRKFSALADMDIESEKAGLFVAVEDWINGGPDLPAGVIRQTVNDWYVKNRPFSGTWRVGGKKIDPAKIKKPCFVVVPAKDKIVPPASSRALARQIKGAKVFSPDCGHISMMVGRNAENDVWEPLHEWIRQAVCRSSS